MINDYIKYINNAFEKANLSTIENASNSQKLLFLYTYYHYFSADDSKVIDIVDSLIENKFIHAVILDEESDENQIDLNHVLLESENKISLKLIVEIFDKLILELNNSINALPESNLLKKMKDIGYNSERQIHLNIITDSKLNPKIQEEIDNFINQKNAINRKVKLRIVTYLDIEFEILELEDPKENVEKGFIEIDDSNNILEFGKENSILVNLKASSLKDNYLKHGFRGLFSMNLRYYVKKKDIDDDIRKSIQTKQEEFWYLNNGIIIVCEDYKMNKNKIELKNFSIINGGQTTKLIGTTDFSKDFFLICKIIKISEKSKEEKTDFTYRVAQATNSQKPIKSKDLVSNKPEQKNLKDQLSKVGVFIQIKRGEKVNKRIFKEPWQNTTNEEYAQIINSFIYQKPGKSRSSKASLTNDKNYPILFGKNYDISLVVELLKIKAHFKKYAANVVENEYNDELKVGLIKVSTFVYFAVIGLLAKIFYNPEIVIGAIDKLTRKQKLDFYISQITFNHKILNKNLTKIDSKLDFLFDYIYENYLLVGFERIRDFKPETDYSNFTKLDSNYLSFIAKLVIRDFEDSKVTNIKKIINDIFYLPTPKEKTENEALFSEVKSAYEKWINEPRVDNFTVDDVDLIEELKEYRKRIWYSSRKRIKPYEVFTDKQLKDIILNKPSSFSELETIRNFSNEQIEKFGEEIIQIIDKYR
jgi:hypothetical protein